MMNPMAGHYLNNKRQEIGQKVTDWLEREVQELREQPLDYVSSNTVAAVRNYWDLAASMAAAYGFAVGNNDLFFTGAALGVFGGVRNPFTNTDPNRSARNFYGGLGTFFTLLSTQSSSSFEEIVSTSAIVVSALAIPTLENSRRKRVEKQKLEELVIHLN